ncbi:hypothetical protein [Sorangium atrum]|uniref:Uncharacterized protein n=1 Tax=Sorangium atrum TaxID=2995308 RepID=A0ABT5C371_9BACT|nr:hypothetical protein [Sorangium aterium]MDC0680787.1 hypothetical protein [Sorangium aterium]
MLLGNALHRLHEAEANLGESFRAAAERHADHLDIAHLCLRFAAQCERRAEGLRPFARKHGVRLEGALERRIGEELRSGARRALAKVRPRTGVAGAELFADLRRLYPMAHDCEIGWVLLGEAGHAARDEGLKAFAEAALPEKEVQIRWLKTTLRESAVQLLVFS